jgi:hypothetical protein
MVDFIVSNAIESGQNLKGERSEELRLIRVIENNVDMCDNASRILTPKGISFKSFLFWDLL